MKNLQHLKSAFSMLELIFVIVILGIVSSIGAEVIAQVYESYIVQRAQYRANTKTEQALNQIANRLRYAIPGTVGARVSKTSAFISITEITSTAQRDVLQWVGEDGDSFEAMTSTSRRPGWSGFIDLNQSTTTTLVSPSSNLGLTDEIIQKLSGGSKTISNAKLYFPNGLPSINVTAGSTGENINVSGLSSGSTISERYKLAWSSYAIVFEGSDLWLYYNFAPNFGASLGTIKSKLLSNVTTFSFQGSEGSLRIKVCQYESIDSNVSVAVDTTKSAHSCKEKIVLY
ncbi:pilus assembly FimT family protein [Sulfurovum sp. NBC37-1]|uniref:pilus assembly FimT family protein n=1 Tax=Sulfurovum sp. (strain NBC37-1) TaxID=387093 RepID=UPI0001587C58|nr:type II secretion system protein [Sulfurovum sp. NBC37-1]BAF72857.1 conserved hypothetical protein [Sulfurovum sp. NBC37-1]